MANADRIIDFESALGIDIEHSIQDAVVDSVLVHGVGDFSYAWFHWLHRLSLDGEGLKAYFVGEVVVALWSP